MNQALKVVVLVALLAGLGWGGYKTFGPKASAAPDDELAACPNGTVACPNSCLKRETEGWRSKSVSGHPDTDIWMTFEDNSGHGVAYNQNHIGHVISFVNGTFVDTGVCPVCRGRTRVCK